jgi:hypothetical protein
MLPFARQAKNPSLAVLGRMLKRAARLYDEPRLAKVGSHCGGHQTIRDHGLGTANAAGGSVPQVELCPPWRFAIIPPFPDSAFRTATPG